MKRTLMLGTTVLVTLLGLVSASSAQVWVRAPFVRVGVGDGVYVRAPFVNLYVPGDGPVYGPRIVTVPPAIVVPQPPPASEALPAPKQIVPPNGPPAAVQPAQVPTLEAFVKSFQAKAGSYDVTVLNPTTNQPTSVRFTLPEGTPRRVIVTRHSIEWVYALRTWVRVEFDRDGAIVTAR